MDNWLEPALAPPKPSFAEAGIERHGVVANMAPLGTLPSAKVLKAAARPDSMEPTGRGGVVKKSGASSVSATPSESVTTPEPAVNPPRLPSVPAAVEEVAKDPTPPLPAPVAAPTPPPPTPQTPTQAQHSISRQISAGSVPYGQSVFALNRPIPAIMPRPVPQPVVPPPMINANGEFDINLAITDRVVESAVAQALDERRWPTAYALRTIYDDHRLNPRMVRLIDAIYNGRADDDQRKQFNAVMSHKKKEGRKDRTGEYYFNGDGSDPLPPKTPQLSSGNPFYSANTPSGRSVTGARSMSDAQARRSSFNQSSMSATSPCKESDPSLHGSKRHKSNSFQPPSDLDVHGTGNAATNTKANGIKEPQQAQPQSPPAAQQNGTPKVTRPKTRSQSMSSSSSLSSLDEADIGSGGFSNTASPLHKTKDSSHQTRSGGGGRRSQGSHSPRLAHTRAHAQAQATTANAPPNSFSSSLVDAIDTHPDGPSTRNNNKNKNNNNNHTQQITTSHKPGPKTFTFSTANANANSSNLSPSPVPGALPSSTNNNNHHPASNSRSSHRRHPSSANSSMAPAALLPSSKNPSSSGRGLPPSTVFKIKKDQGKDSARSADENDLRSRLKRKAKEKTIQISGPVIESFVRSQVSRPESESASDGGESIAVGPLKKKQRLTGRLFSKRTRQSQAINDDSDTPSSPTLLSFQPDLAPGSLSASRAGTPNTSNRPTRKGKTGTGLRVKTS